ncbi:hypothetical protein [Rhodococcus sp. 2G]|uniref:hypothetical protein n=1 Tax=Rhodococcus TaxID=1827 RepID=UPI00090453D1|nr:hypothetical protein [Rhodococcus sp. 2G]APE11566.1 hypothetical protein BO226_22115 [Rhodococcus sp. 2G]
MDNTLPELITDRIGPLVEPVHEAFEFARHTLQTKHEGLYDEREQRWLRTHALRGGAWRNLRDLGLPASWALTGRHRRNGEIHLAYGSGEMQVRVLHTFPVNYAPVAGYNGARRAYYTNTAIEELSDPFTTQRLILLWQEPDDSAEFELTMIRPLEPGRIGRHVKSDLVIPMPRTLSAFEALTFDPQDDEQSLLFEIDDDELEDGTDV